MRVEKNYLRKNKIHIALFTFIGLSQENVTSQKSKKKEVLLAYYQKNP